MKKKKELTAFAFAITGTDKKARVTYAPKYYFDPVEQIILLGGEDESDIGQIDLVRGDVIRVDIYDETNPAHNYVQTILSGRSTS